MFRRSRPRRTLTAERECLKGISNTGQGQWIRNCWYVIAWDHEIPAANSTELFHRTVLNEPILVMRQSDGSFVGLADRCCHRLAPLSAGRREDDCVRCGYHGLKFDGAGVCIEAPGGGRIPARAVVRAYPVVCRNKWVFVWMGDPTQADEALLPDNFSCDSPDWVYHPGYMRYETPYPPTSTVGSFTTSSSPGRCSCGREDDR